MKTILITGVAGFIGSHLAETLLREDHYVIGVDNFLTGLDSNIKRLQHTAASSDGKFDFHEFDVTDETIVDFLDTQYDSIDHIYHLACPASPKDFAGLGVEILEVCSHGVRNTLKIAEKKGARFLHGSTSEVYGDPLVTPQTENCHGNVSILGPRSCYDEGKRFAESYIINFSKKHAVDFRIARIFNTYGEYMRKDDGRVIPNFIEQLKSGESITIYGDGSQTRSFCYISDMVRGLKKLMNYDGFGTESHQDEPIERVFNLGNPHEIQIIELAKVLANIIGEELNTTRLPLPQDDPKRRCPQITKAQDILDFELEHSLEDGLRRTVEKW